MKIVVLSDTHSYSLPRMLIDEIKKADMVIHAGDFTDVSVLDALRKDKEVRAVYGNMDGMDLRRQLPQSQVFRCADVAVGLFHGEGASAGLLERVQKRFSGEDVQVVIFGHTHEPMNETINGVLYFNPGSPTDNYRAPYCSFGILEITGRNIKSRIVRIS